MKLRDGSRLKMCGMMLSLMVMAVPVLTTGSSGLDLTALPSDPALKAKAVMDYVDDLWRGGSSHASLSMTIKTANWERTIEMDGWSFGKNYSLVRITLPRKEQGTATLKHQNDIYNYLPKTDRTIKITSGMMMSSWMGSHFTNDDLVKESRFADDYFSKITFDGERDRKKLWVIQLDPKPDAPVVWGKVVFEVDQTDVMPVKADYFSETGELVRTMVFTDYAVMSGRQIPTRMKLTPQDKPGENTELVYRSIEFDLPIGPDFFSLKELKK